MITSAFIDQVRRAVGDVPERHLDVISGDGSTTVYKLKYEPVLEDSITLTVDSSAFVEGASGGFTLDDDTGVVDFNQVVSANQTIQAKYKGVNLTNKEYIDAIGEVIDEMGDRFYSTVVRDPSGITLSADIQLYDCPTSCIGLFEFLESDDYTSAGNFGKPPVNWRYDRNANKLLLGSKPTKANSTQISYFKKLAKPTALSSTLDLKDSWAQLVKEGVKAKYYRAMAGKVSQQGNVNTEEGMLKANQLRQVASDHERRYELLRRRVKPVMPTMAVNYDVEGSGPVR